MAGNMVGSISKDAQEIPGSDIKIYTSGVCTFEGRNHDRDDALNGLDSNHLTTTSVDATNANLLHNSEAVAIITVENVRSHEGEYRHDIMQHGIRRQTSQSGHQKKSLVEGLRVIRH